MTTKEVIKATDIACLFCLCVAAAYGLMIYPDLPDKIPIHFNGKGEPDKWGSKPSIWFLYGVVVFTYLVMKFSVKFTANSKPETLRKWNTGYKGMTNDQIKKYAIATGQEMSYFNLLIVCTLCVMFYNTVRVALGQATDIGSWMLPVVILIGTLTLTIRLVMLKKKVTSDE